MITRIAEDRFKVTGSFVRRLRTYSNSFGFFGFRAFNGDLVLVVSFHPYVVNKDGLRQYFRFSSEPYSPFILEPYSTTVFGWRDKVGDIEIRDESDIKEAMKVCLFGYGKPLRKLTFLRKNIPLEFLL